MDMSKPVKWRVHAQMTSVVFCDEDGTANFVEHLMEGNTLRFKLTDEEVGSGYIRAMTDKDEPIILYIGDWTRCGGL
jgi:hypothetical protein